jgi:hypothetical protein
MNGFNLSINARKALAVHIGEEPVRELLEHLNRLAQRVEHLERTKVDVTNILPSQPTQLTIRRAA